MGLRSRALCGAGSVLGLLGIGAGFATGLFIASPIALAAGGVAVVATAGLGFLALRKPPPAAPTVVDGDVTDQELEEFIERCSLGVRSLYVSHARMERGSVKDELNKVLATLDSIIANCRNDPSDIRTGGELPFKLGRLAKNISGYVEVIGNADPKTARELQSKILELIRNADEDLLTIRSRMLRDNEIEVTAQTSTNIGVFSGKRPSGPSNLN